MTEDTFEQMAAEAKERHKFDPKYNKDLTESDLFWHRWSGWMKKRAAMGSGFDLSYHGKNDPTARKAIRHVMRGMKGGRL